MELATNLPVVIIPDIHQDVDWAQRILDREKGKPVVFIGDFYDSRRNVASAETTAIFHKFCLHKYNVILGNHELRYMECWSHVRQRRNKKFHLHPTSGFSNNKSKDVNKTLLWDEWQRSHMFVYVHGHMISHAGFREDNWNFYQTLSENLARLEKATKEAMAVMSVMPSPFFQIGKFRDGDAEFGGPCWLDWDEEFRDNLPIPQIVGHTRHDTPQQIGKCWDLDCMQTYYGVLHPDGRLELKTA